jgi:hypothetical protein
MQKPASSVVLGIGFAVCAFAGTFIALESYSPWLAFIWIPLAVAAVALAWCFTTVRLRYDPPSRGRSGAYDPQLEPPQQHFDALLQDALRLQSDGVTSVLSYVIQVLNLERSRRRVVDQIDLRPDRTRRSVTSDVTLPPALGADDLEIDELFLPAMTVPKGRAYSRLRVTSGSGTVRVLNPRDAQIVTTLAIVELFNLAFGLTSTDWTVTHVLRLYAALAFVVLGPPSADWQSTRGQHLAPKVATTFPIDEAANLEAYFQLIDFVVRHIDQYRVVAAVPPQRHAQIIVEYGIPTWALMGGVERDDQATAIERWVRRRVRRLSTVCFLPLTRGTHCATYHVEVATPKGSLVTDAGAIVADTREAAANDPDPSLDYLHRWFISTPTPGSSHFDLETRNLAGVSPVPFLMFKVYERPTGTTALAFGWALIALPVVLILGAATPSPNTPSDLVAAGIGIPTLIAGLIGSYGFAVRRCLTVSMLGTLACAGAVFVLVTALISYLVEVVKDGTVSLDAWWHILAGLAVSLTGSSGILLLIRYRRYVRVRRRADLR